VRPAAWALLPALRSAVATNWAPSPRLSPAYAASAIRERTTWNGVVRFGKSPPRYLTEALGIVTVPGASSFWATSEVVAKWWQPASRESAAQCQFCACSRTVPSPAAIGTGFRNPSDSARGEEQSAHPAGLKCASRIFLAPPGAAEKLASGDACYACVEGRSPRAAASPSRPGGGPGQGLCRIAGHPRRVRSEAILCGPLPLVHWDESVCRSRGPSSRISPTSPSGGPL